MPARKREPGRHSFTERSQAGIAEGPWSPHTRAWPATGDRPQFRRCCAAGVKSGLTPICLGK